MRTIFIFTLVFIFQLITSQSQAGGTYTVKWIGEKNPCVGGVYEYSAELWFTPSDKNKPAYIPSDLYIDEFGVSGTGAIKLTGGCRITIQVTSLNNFIIGCHIIDHGTADPYDRPGYNDHPYKVITPANLQGVTPSSISGSTSIYRYDVTPKTYSVSSLLYTNGEVVNNYGWIFPSGWSFNGTISNGYTPFLTNSPSISVIPNNCTGGNISVYGISKCGDTYSNNSLISVSRPFNNYSITGNPLICSSGTTFTINSLPPFNSIVWTPGQNLSLSSQNGSSCTFIAAGDGPSTISAKVYTDCGEISIPAKPVWLGAPSTPTTIYGFENDGIVFGQNSIYEFTIYPPDIQNATSFQWVVGGGTILSGQGTNQISVRTASNSTGITKYFDVSVRVENSCGWSSYLWRSGYIGTGIGPASLVITPNPSTAETTFSLVTETNDAAQIATDWTCDVYNSFQGLKEKKTKLKTAETKINTSGWKEGVYIVRATIGDKVITEKMIVKH